jgi:hypothetical protein
MIRVNNSILVSDNYLIPLDINLVLNEAMKALPPQERDAFVAFFVGRVWALRGFSRERR